MKKINLTVTMTIVSIIGAYMFTCLSILYGENDNTGISSTLVNEYRTSPSTGSVTTKYGQFTNNTYTSNVQNLEGYTRLKGLIVSDLASPGATYFNQLAGGTDTANWHGTDTVNYVQIGNIFRGEVDIPIWGRYGKLTINGFGTASFASVNLYISNESISETAVKWLESAVTVGTTTIQLAPQSSSRKYLLIVNDGTSNDLYISGSTPITPSTGGLPVFKNNGFWSDDSGLYYDKVYGVTLSGTTSVRIMELK